MKIPRFFPCILAAAVLPQAVAAQSPRLILQGGMGFNTNDGVTANIYQAGGGIEWQPRALYVRGTAMFSNNPKLDTGGNGHSYRLNLGSYAGPKLFKAGGGISLTQFASTRYTKTAVRPFVGGAFTHHSFTVLGDYLLPGRDVNELRGLRFTTLAEIRKATPSIRLWYELGFYSFRQPAGGPWQRSIGVNPGIEFRF